MLEWFDSQPWRYWALAWSLFGLLGAASLGALFASVLGEKARARSARLAPRWLFLALLVAAFAAFRWPILCVDEELNPDESQIIAGAITLQSDPVFWRSVDGTTHGPLDDYVLIAVRLAGLRIDYLSARLVGGALVLGAVLLVYFILARKFPESLARVGCLPAFCFFAFNTHWDFVHYSSEHLPVFLLALGACLLSADLFASAARRPRSWRWIAGAVTLGAAPLAKLQAAPIAAALLFVAAVLDLSAADLSRADRLRRLGWLVGGAISVPLLYTVVLLISGDWMHAWNSYIRQNLSYAGEQHLTRAQMLRTFWQYADTGTGFFAFAAGCATFLAVAALRLPGYFRSALRPLALAAAFLAAALLAVLAPGRQYTHYLLMLVVPATLLTGVIFAAWWQSTRADATETRVLLLAAFAAALVWPQVQSRLTQPHPYLGKLVEYARRPPNPVAREIMRYARPGETLGHWGWMCRYYVLTGLRQATREAHTTNLIQASPQRNYYLDRYLADLARSQPPVFIDTVGPGNFVFQDRVQANESFPRLHVYLAGHYRLVADLAGTRIYVRNDRQAQP